MPMKPRITIIGLGRLGASVGLALKKTGAELELVGHDKDRDAMNAAVKAGAIDKAEWNLFNACEGAGLIHLTMPLAGVLETIELLKDDVPPGVIVTDTASVKAPVLAAAQSFKPGVSFIGGHPVFRPTIEGLPFDDKPNADLFQRGVYCLTPTAASDPEAIQVISGYVAMLGAKPLFLDVAEHDGLVAGAEHLAIALETVLLKTITASSGWRELNKFASDDFQDATRLAARDAASNARLMLSQREPLQGWIDQTIETLRDLKQLLAQNDAAALDKWVKTAQAAREQWLNNQVGTAPQGADYSEVRSGALRLFLGGLATRVGGDKKK